MNTILKYVVCTYTLTCTCPCISDNTTCTISIASKCTYTLTCTCPCISDNTTCTISIASKCKCVHSSSMSVPVPFKQCLLSYVLLIHSSRNPSQARKMAHTHTRMKTTVTAPPMMRHWGRVRKPEEKKQQMNPHLQVC